MIARRRTFVVLLAAATATAVAIVVTRHALRPGGRALIREFKPRVVPLQTHVPDAVECT